MNIKKAIMILISIIVAVLAIMIYMPKTNAANNNSIESVAIAVEETGDRPNTNLQNIAKSGNKIIITIGFKEQLDNSNSLLKDIKLKIKIGTNGEEKTLTNEPITALSTNTISFIYIVNEEDSGNVNITSESITINENEYSLPASADVITVDNKSPQPSQFRIINVEAGEYEAGKNIQIEIVFDEEIHIEEIPELYIKFGEGNNKAITSEMSYTPTSIIYEYNIKEGDNGELQIVGISGGKIYDGVGNESVLDTEFEQVSTNIFAKTSEKAPSNTQNQNSINTKNDNTTTNKILPFTGSGRIIVII